MKNQRSRILAMLLAICMVIGMMPTMLFAASAEDAATTTTWTNTKLEDIKSTDTVAITMTKEDTTYALPTTINEETATPIAIIGTVEGDKLTLPVDATACGWTITGDANGYTIATGESYLSLANAARGVTIGETEATFTLTSYNYLTAVVGEKNGANVYRDLGVYVGSTPDWRCYTGTSTGAANNIKNETLNFWVLGEGQAVEPKPTEPAPTEPAPTEPAPTEPAPTTPSEPATPSEPGEATLLTELNDGDKVYVYAAKAGLAMSTTTDESMIAGIEAEVNDNVLSATGDMMVLTVHMDGDGNCTFTTDDGLYLTTTDKNVLTLEATETDEAVWNVSAFIDEESGEFVASLVKNVVSSNLFLEAYNGYFTTYPRYYNNTAFHMWFFSAGEGTATSNGGFVNELHAGDKVVIYQPESGMVVNTTASDAENNKNLLGTEAILTDDGTLTGYTDADVWTVDIIEGTDGNSYYTFASAAGKYMVGGFSGLYLQDETTTGWSLSTYNENNVAVEGTFMLRTTYPVLGWAEANNDFEMQFQYGANCAVRFYAVSSGNGGTVTPAKKTVSAPSASPKSGEVMPGDEITFTCKTEGATILYKVNDGEEWLTYTAPIAVTADTTFTVKAVKEDMKDSKEVTYKYTVYVEPELGEHRATLVTDASQLSSGDLIIIVTKDNASKKKDEHALGQTQKANNRDYGTVIKNKFTGECSFDPETAQIIQLESGVEEGTYAMYAYNGAYTGYLYAPLGTGSQGSNWLRTQDTKDINGSWTIEIQEDTTAVITSRADKGSNTIRYNNGIFSCYGPKGQAAVVIYKLNDGNERPGLPEEGSQVAIYNLSAKGVLGGMTGDLDDIYGCKVNSAAATIVDGKADCSNGSVIFTVSKDGDFYRFYNESFGYLASYGGGNNTYYTQEADEWINWTLEEYNGGYKMKSSAYFDDAGTIKPQYMQYFSNSFTTWGMHAVTDRDVFTYYFYPCANDKLTDGVVNEPKAVFGNLADAVVGQRYQLHFTIDSLFGVKELKVTLGENTLEYTELNGYYTAVIPAELISGEKLTVTVSGSDNKNVEINTVVEINVKDEPGITNLRPVANSETGDEKRPEISAILTNVGENPTIELKVNDEVVAFTYADGKVSYTPAADFADGRVTVSLTVTRADGKSITKNWNFVVGESNYQLLFGQLHSHNGEFSDGSGNLTLALEHVANIPEEDNIDFVAFTDHSNYYDNDVAGGSPIDALYDLSLATPQAQEKWTDYKTRIAEFNATHTDRIAIAGFEMTWSGGPGHMNTFCTDGIVSRQNNDLNNKTADAGMRLYYELLSREEGVDSITQFNHPGTMFGNFSDFAWWSEEADSRVYLVEVGNGEGLVGSSGYYPSYEQYTLALDKGWHIGPTNNQDNHGGGWGNKNTCRDVVLVESFSEEAIYDAIRALRIYATEDKNLEIGYTVNDLPMGTIIEEVPETLSFDITFMDPDDTDSISKVELIVNSGKVAYTCDDEDVLATGIINVELKPEYSYYYVRITEADGDLAVTAPVWVGESLKLGIDEMTASNDSPIAGESVTLSTVLSNAETFDAQVKSVTYTTEGSKVLATDTNPQILTAGGKLTLTWNYTPELAKQTTITVTVVIEMDGKEYTFSASIDLDVQDASSIAYIGFDAAHENEYVAGYNKDLMANFTTLAGESSVRVENLTTSDALIAACASDKYAALVITAPSRRSGKTGFTYTEAELKALADYNANGGIIMITGLGDSNDQMSDVIGTAATQNALLEALGSSLRLADDGLYEGTSFSLTLDAFGTSELVEGLTTGITYYGGSTIYAVDGEGKATTTLPATVETMLFGSKDATSEDKDGDGGVNTTKYAYAEGDDRFLVMAAEQLDGKGLIIVSGTTLIDDYDLAIPATNGNNALAENIFNFVNPIKITSIADVRKQTEAGYRYVIEGTVTSNASGYDTTTAFFDCIYIQDATGGMCCFPIANSYKIGDVVRVTGTTHFFQGEAEFSVIDSEKLGETTPVAPVAVSLTELNSRGVEGNLVTIKGYVTEVTIKDGIPESIYVSDASGEVVRIHIDGYINASVEIEGLVAGCAIEATGLASFDNAYDNKNASDVRLRTRDRNEIICSTCEHTFENGNCTNCGMPDPSVKPFENPFTDVVEGTWYYNYVMTAAETGLVNGYKDDTFRPELGLTRAEMVTLLYRMAGSPAVEGKPSFTDLPNDWCHDAIAWAEQNGITTGTSDTTFEPDLAVTREQMVTMLWRMAGKPAAQADLTGFEDADKITSWAKDAINWAVSEGIINGTKFESVDGLYLAPQDSIKRCEATKILVVYDSEK